MDTKTKTVTDTSLATLYPMLRGSFGVYGLNYRVKLIFKKCLSLNRPLNRSLRIFVYMIITGDIYLLAIVSNMQISTPLL